MLTENQIQIIIKRLESIPGLVAIYLHGSVAKGIERSESDLDLAILLDRPNSDTWSTLELSGELEAVINRPVHISYLSHGSTVFVKEVITGGERIYCSNEVYCDSFEMYALSAYAELNYQRRKVLLAYES
jgi:predicted nucleotidyltransferase